MHQLAPEDWEGWLVLADQLSRRQDGRGQLLRLNHALVCGAWTSEERQARVVQLEQQVALWLVMHVSTIGVAEAESVERYTLWRKDFAQLQKVAPPCLSEAMAWTGAQVLGQASADSRWVTGICDAACQEVIAWIGEAFAAVPPLDRATRSLRQAQAVDEGRHEVRQAGDSEGPWQEIPDQYLLQNQLALTHLDHHGLLYYLPSVMCFVLRHLCRPHPEDQLLSESLDFTLQPSSPSLQSHQRRRMSLLTAPQRGAIAGFCWLTQNDALTRWVRAAGQGDDWMEGFAGDTD